MSQDMGNNSSKENMNGEAATSAEGTHQSNGAAANTHEDTEELLCEYCIAAKKETGTLPSPAAAQEASSTSENDAKEDAAGKWPAPPYPEGVSNNSPPIDLAPTSQPTAESADATAEGEAEEVVCEDCLAAKAEGRPLTTVATAQETTSAAEPAQTSQTGITAPLALTSENPSYQALPQESACHWATAPAEPSTEHDQDLEPSDKSLPFSGKVALITGSGRGIGRGIALELARRGCSIVVNYSSSAGGADKVVQEIHDLMTGAKAIALRCDVSKPAEICKLFDEAVAQFGRLDIVVSNSGREIWKDELEVTQEDFDSIFDVNCRGQFFVAQQGMKHLGRGGRIILMSSIAASGSHVSNHALYAGSKAAVEGITRAFAIDCGPKGITCNAIAPGGIKTEMFDANAWHYAPAGTPDTPIEQIDAGIAKACPLNRVGTPADIGRAVSLLASPESEWINGQIIRLSGGGI